VKKLCFIFVILLFSLTEARVFYDANDYPWAVSVVDKWSDRGIISGYIDGSFGGNNKLKRSEMITIINRLNNSNEKMNIKPAKDVNNGDWFYNEMSIALKNGLIELDENYNLRPNDYATREEVFVILAKLFKLKYNGNSTDILSSKFNDYQLIEGKNYPYIAALVKEGYISGYENNTLKPKSSITRAELIAIIDKIAGDVYTTGKISNQVLGGNIIINGEGVLLDNVNVDGYIFIMDGAKDEVPILKNVDSTKGIVSRVDNVFVTGNDDVVTFEEKEIIEPVFIRAIYSESDWTNDDVTVTLTFSDSDYEVINNSGKNKYTFEENGEFVFVAANSDGNTIKFKAKVDNIDIIEPKFIIEKNVQTDKAVITLMIEEDEMSPIEGAYYMKGSASASTVVNRGEEIINNTFEVTENGAYTIVVQDEAGNRARKKVTVKLGGQTSGVQN